MSCLKDTDQETVKRTRHIFKDAIESLHHRAMDDDAWEDATPESIQLLLERLEINWNGYKRASSDLDGFCMAHNIVVRYNDELDHVAQRFTEARTMLTKRSTTMSSMVTGASAHIDNNLPKYSGKFQEWPSWSRNVTSRILDTELSVQLKAAEIMASLEGDAKQIFGSNQVKNEYELKGLWLRLQADYEYKYQLARTHISSILDLPKLNQPSANGLFSMVHSTEGALNALRRLHVSTSSWDLIVRELLLRKLDPETKQHYDSASETEEAHTLSALLQFINSHGTSIQDGVPNIELTQSASSSIVDAAATGQGSQPKEAHQGQAYGGNALAAEANARKLSTFGHCEYRPICKQESLHFIWNCKAFRQLDNEKRIEFITEKGICKRCALERHDIEICTAETCGLCENDQHNYLFCPKHKPAIKLVKSAVFKRSKSIPTRASRANQQYNSNHL